MIFPLAKSKQTVVKLEDSSRDKREEERKSEGLFPRLGLIIRVAVWWRCFVDTLRGLVLLFYRIKQTDLSFEETLISFWGFLIRRLTSLYPELGEKLHCFCGATVTSPTQH